MGESILIYENKLSCMEDVKGFKMEGKAVMSFPMRRLRLENALSSEAGQKANYVIWCPEEFPSDIEVRWKFKPLREPGLAILFLAAMGREGQDLFDSSLQPRTGEYSQYHHGDINAFHISYFRRKELSERAFHTCNLRKSYGFHLVSQGGDPMPDADEINDFYEMCARKEGNTVSFYINELLIFHFEDDGKSYGPLLGGGKIGFRQLAPMIAEYADLRVYRI